MQYQLQFREFSCSSTENNTVPAAEATDAIQDSSSQKEVESIFCIVNESHYYRKVCIAGQVGGQPPVSYTTCSLIYVSGLITKSFGILVSFGTVNNKDEKPKSYDICTYVYNTNGST
ncbi:hypothetical protein NECAME_06251 [Necator americanus]|uniref:Uncharacterized protein n=1 Tax=Necator americanus TaxID=51031 RepID=W2TVA4_NECAM|nr:hypothetical protein NECAME_06251 [Necator americanus]ETN85738.1 hypothetical protein NECAME_06251 [Necator americanus]